MGEKEAVKELNKMVGDRMKSKRGISEKQHELFQTAMDALEEIQQYRAIGTVKECREAMEKQRAKKRKLDSYCRFDSYECPVCGAEPIEGSNFCHKCGQRLE